MLQEDIGCVLPRTAFAPADLSEEAGGDDWRLVPPAVAPVEGLEVETVLMLSRPRKVILINHGPSPTIAQGPSPPETAIPSRVFPLPLAPFLTLGLCTLLRPHIRINLSFRPPSDHLALSEGLPEREVETAVEEEHCEDADACEA